MLTAIYKNRTIYVSDFPENVLKSASDNGELQCPDCHEKVIFKSCSGKISHFSHYSSDCSFPFREPESLEHQSGKAALFSWLIGQFGGDDSYIEKKIDATNQRSDTFVSSISTAVEFQCSPILGSTWERRNELYKSADINDIWILGYSMHRYHAQNTYTHKINQLEEKMLEKYQKVIYYNVLSNHFIFLIPDEVKDKTLYGKEYYFKTDEVFLKDGRLKSKYDYFMNMQSARKKYVETELEKAKETDRYIKKVKEKAGVGEKILATSKQINYIKYLLTKNEQKIPYKLHGITKTEASTLIEELQK